MLNLNYDQIVEFAREINDNACGLEGTTIRAEVQSARDCAGTPEPVACAGRSDGEVFFLILWAEPESLEVW